MSRPIAAYVGHGLSHPIRLAAFRSGASFMSISEALELVTDLTTAVCRAIQEEDNRDRAAGRMRKQLGPGNGP